VPLAVCDYCASALVGRTTGDEAWECPYCGRPVRRVTLAEFMRYYRLWRAQERNVTLGEPPHPNAEAPKTPEAPPEPGDDETETRR
jgi:hypothetical protein